MRYIHKLAPIAVGRVMLLGHWSGGLEIADPVGGPREVYEKSTEEIMTCCDLWVKKIIAMESLV